MGLQIHDAELTALQHNEPLLRHLASRKTQQSSTRVFSATTPSAWASAVRQEAAQRRSVIEDSIQPLDPFTAYLKLEGLGVRIADYWHESYVHDADFTIPHKALLSWHEMYKQMQEKDRSDPLCLIALWHWTYMNLLVDFDQLERVIGRDGVEAADEAVGYIKKWISSPTSKRCVLHAFLLQKRVQCFYLNEVPALHVPRILFSAAIVWHCYIQYGPGNDVLSTSTQFDTNFPEFLILGRESQAQLSYITNLRWTNNEKSSIKAATLCEIGYLLQRMNQWGVARRFATIVACLIGGGLEEI